MLTSTYYQSRTKSSTVAIIHDALVVPAGSERVALNFSNLFPDAPIYTSAYLPDNTFSAFKNRKIHTLPFSKLVKTEKLFKILYPLWLIEISRLDLSKFDIVISSANYLAKFIRPGVQSRHICYLHNPIRFLWKRQVYTKDSLPYGSISLPILNFVIPLLKRFDIEKTQMIDHLLTNSRNTANQIEQIYHRRADVIYPPVEVGFYEISNTPSDYYLYAGRLISHKRVDIAIKACKNLRRRLIIAGDGLERKNLQDLGGEEVLFIGRVTDQQLKNLYMNCKALLFPSDEDFGLVPVEAQASGRPVIAYRSGGALETVIEGETGLFFNEQNEGSLMDAIQQFETMCFDPLRIRKNALNFDTSVFRKKFQHYMSTHIQGASEN